MLLTLLGELGKSFPRFDCNFDMTQIMDLL